VAARLLLAAERLARERGCADLRLEIRTDNQPSLRLFHRHGFSIFGHYRGYYEDGRDAYRLAKSISPRMRALPAPHFP
jgi:ribosomal protein S18 acetylase RimI-like enzyme